MGKKTQQNFFIIGSMIKYNVRDEDLPRRRIPTDIYSQPQTNRYTLRLSSSSAQALEVLRITWENSKMSEMIKWQSKALYLYKSKWPTQADLTCHTK